MAVRFHPHVRERRGERGATENEGSCAAKPHGFLKREQLTEEKLAKVRRLNEIAQARGQTMAQMALAWNLRHEGMTSVLVGTSRVHQIEENVGALKNLQFTEEELKDAARILAK